MKTKIFALDTDNFQLVLTESDDGSVSVIIEPKEKAHYSLTKIRERPSLYHNPILCNPIPIGESLGATWKKTKI